MELVMDSSRVSGSFMPSLLMMPAPRQKKSKLADRKTKQQQQQPKKNVKTKKT
jgi:hypothetical protein